MEGRKKRLILARHGETEWNSAFRFQGRTDVPLGPNGLAQADLLSRRLSGVCMDMIYSSPLSRAHQTACIVAGRSSCSGEVIPVEEFSEMSFGSWESLRLAEVRDRYPDLYHPWREDPSSVTPPAGESFGDLIKRVGEGIERVLSGDGDTLLVVCHGGTIRAALSFLVGVPPVSSWKFRVDNCSITAIDIATDRITLRYVNDTVHLHVDGSKAVDLPLA